MILIEVPPNPNCSGCEQTAFNETDKDLKEIRAIVVSTPRGDVLCDAAGVEEGGGFGPAYARRIDDSGEGPAYLVFGGGWGVRFRPKTEPVQPWSLTDASQWGEPFKVYGLTADLLF